MLKPFLLIIVLGFSFIQSEIMSSDILKGVVFPLIFMVSMLLLLIWFLRRPDKNRSGDGGSGDGSGTYYTCDKSSDVDSEMVAEVETST